MNFLLPIIGEFEKKDISKELKKAFFVLCLEFPFVFQEMFATFFNFQLENKNWDIIFSKE